MLRLVEAPLILNLIQQDPKVGPEKPAGVCGRPWPAPGQVSQDWWHPSLLRRSLQLRLQKGRWRIPEYRSAASDCWFLVGGLVAINFIFPEILGISSSQLTFIFFGGVETTNQVSFYVFDVVCWSSQPRHPRHPSHPSHIVFCRPIKCNEWHQFSWGGVNMYGRNGRGKHCSGILAIS